MTDPFTATPLHQQALYALAASDIRKGDAIQPVAGRKLRDCRAESDPYIGRLPGDTEDSAILHWSHQASDNDRHWCTGRLSSFKRGA